LVEAHVGGAVRRRCAPGDLAVGGAGNVDDPDTHVAIGAARRAVRAHRADVDERARLWQTMSTRLMLATAPISSRTN